jgi:hypothetical protein
MARFNAAGGFTQPFKQYVDCSGLEVVAIWNAFHVKAVFNTSSVAGVTANGAKAFREIPIASTQPGDLVFIPGEHTEIVATPGAATTFGAHTDKAPPDKQIGDAGKGAWTVAYEYIGPGSAVTL